MTSNESPTFQGFSYKNTAAMEPSTNHVRKRETQNALDFTNIQRHILGGKFNLIPMRMSHELCEVDSFSDRTDTQTEMD